jgi:hypothetical protein
LAVQIFTFSEEGAVEEPEKSLARTMAEPGFFLTENSRKGGERRTQWFHLKAKKLI